MKTFNESKTWQKLTDDILNAIPEDTSYEDLALAIVAIVVNEYGEHNFKPFLKILNKKLK